MTKPSWGSFRTILLNNKIPQNQQSYYVKRIETFLWFLFGAGSKLWVMMRLIISPISKLRM